MKAYEEIQKCERANQLLLNQKKVCHMRIVEGLSLNQIQNKTGFTMEYIIYIDKVIRNMMSPI